MGQVVGWQEGMEHKVKQILLIKGKSQYDSTSVFLDEMGEELKRQGIEVNVLDGYDEVSYRKMRQLLRQKSYDAVISINGMALEASSTLGADLLKDQVIYCTMLMDHPMIHHQRLMNPYGCSLVLSPDWNHVEYLEKYYPHIWCEGFLAHGGCRAEKPVPYKKRSHAITFMGSYSCPEQIWEGFGQYPLQMRLLVEGCCRYLLEHTDETLEQAIKKELNKLGIACTAEQFAAIGTDFCTADRYVRSYFRDKVVRTIVEAGIPIDVYGDGWEKMEVGRKECLRVHGRVSFRESLEIVADSKINLNVMPWFKNGSHDRVFSAMLCGSVCLTDVSRYLKEECRDGKELVYYHLDALEKLPECIGNLLGKDELGEEIAARGRLMAEQRHTWAARARELLDYLSAVEKMK